MRSKYVTKILLINADALDLPFMIPHIKKNFKSRD